ncbi:MAG TPA: asparagine synthase (glutamine-hydrolyzing) [Vicinamibacterales bacterium]|nr:asparagine synthase (glutamine-hydrolyzing) [Vicinamibacterales bacterium]
MCGFAGVLTTAGFGHDDLADTARRMIAPIAHRGPDDSGIWADADAGIAFGFRRLAIIDLSPSGHQPMWSPSRRFVAMFNGEVYNFADLRRDLERRGFRFRGRSDTEVVLAAFEQWGIADAIPRFVGMFAIAVWDADRRELSLVRDRLGKKPLYVYRQPGVVTFGSELKALVAGPVFDRSIDRAALASYLRYLYVPAPRTIFARAIKIPAGHILTIADADGPLPAARPYWSLAGAAREGLADPIRSEPEAIERLDALMVEAVRSRMVSDVPLGALLSGGIDSSTIVALMQESSRAAVKTYTIGFDSEAFDEASHAARVAEYLGTDHTELKISGSDAERVIPRLAGIFDEPFADPSQLPTVFVSELARRHVTVALCGDGGDELFGGYNRYVYGTRMLPRVNRLPAGMRRWLAAGVESMPARSLNRFGGRVGERVHKIGTLMGAATVGGMYRSLLSAWQQPESIVRDAPDDSPIDANERIVDDGDPPRLVDRMMLADQLTYLPDDLLAKVDRASMAVSLEVRAPILDHRVVELSWRLPPALKLRGRIGKWALRQILYRRVPRELVDRPKMGFSVPIDQWLRGPLRGWAGGLLAPDALADGGLLDPAPIARAWRDLQDGRRQTGVALWAVVMFQAWKERWAA